MNFRGVQKVTILHPYKNFSLLKHKPQTIKKPRNMKAASIVNEAYCIILISITSNAYESSIYQNSSIIA